VSTLDGSSSLALTLGGGLLVKLAGAQFGQQTGFFHSALEAAQRNVERLIFLDTYTRHFLITPKKVQ